MIFSNKEIRRNSDITHIVIHHTGDFRPTSGKRHNTSYLTAGIFGSPYDIIINENGKVDLSPQWIYALDGLMYKEDVPLNDLIPSYLHHYAQIGKSEEEKKNYAHIGLMGNFDLKKPSFFQLSSLRNVLEKLCIKLELCIRTSLLYPNETRFITSPGLLFPEKEKIIKELLQKTRISRLCTSES